MTRISLVVSDVDGTLLTKDKTLTDGARNAVRRLHDAGIGFTITSSRPTLGMRFLLEPLAITLPIGSFNGSSIVDPQLIPAGLLLTVPGPCVLTLSVYKAANIAFTLTDPAPATLHALVPLHHPPDHPLKADPDAGVAVRVTVAPLGKVAEHRVPQFMPVGLLAMVPAPVPPSAAVMVNPPPDEPLQAGFEKAETPALLNAATW